MEVIVRLLELKANWFEVQRISFSILYRVGFYCPCW